MMLMRSFKHRIPSSLFIIRTTLTKATEHGKQKSTFSHPVHPGDEAVKNADNGQHLVARVHAEMWFKDYIQLLKDHLQSVENFCKDRIQSIENFTKERFRSTELLMLTGFAGVFAGIAWQYNENKAAAVKLNDKIDTATEKMNKKIDTSTKEIKNEIRQLFQAKST